LPTPSSQKAHPRYRALPYLAALVALIAAALTAVAYRPLALVALLAHPLGAVLLASLFTTLVVLGLLALRATGSDLGAKAWRVAPAIALSAFGLTALAVALPLHLAVSAKLELSGSSVVGQVAPGHILLVVNDDFGNNALPRPDSMTLVEILPSGEITLTPIARDWVESLIEPGRSLASVHFGIDDCKPYCELKDVVARASLSQQQGVGPSTQATLAASVIAAELRLENLSVIELNPNTISQVLQSLAPLELTVDSAIPVGGKWVDEQMVDIRYWVQPGLRQLDAEQALWFARARWTSSNEDRMLRQMQLLQAAFEQRGARAIALGLFNSDGFSTSATLGQLASLPITLNDFLNPSIRVLPVIGR